MNPLDFPLFADENAHPRVVQGLAAMGKDVVAILDEGLGGHADSEILRRAHELGRVVMAHDSDFGALGIRDAQPFVGIVYLRPGHIRPAFVLHVLSELANSRLDVRSPFILVAERKADQLRFRVRCIS